MAAQKILRFSLIRLAVPEMLASHICIFEVTTSSKLLAGEYHTVVTFAEDRDNR
jgi:hypothetical protein